MSYGRLAEAVTSARTRTPESDPPPQYLGGYQTRDLAQITDEMIAWQEFGIPGDGMALPPVFAVVRLIASTIDQLDVTVDGGPPPTWLRSPRRYGAALDLGDLVQWLVTSMALQGRAYVMCTRVGDSWRLDAMHPGNVQSRIAPGAVVALEHLVDGEVVPGVPPFMGEWRDRGRYVLHIPYFVTPDYPWGVSPITAARMSLAGYFAVERQAANLLGLGTYSGGRLETDQDITAATALRYQETWILNRELGRLPVLGAGLRYVNDIISPRDAQWLESRTYNAQQIAMMFGVPPDYLGMAMTGGSSSLSYANAQDNDRRFRRNALAAFTTQIGDALSTLTPLGRGGDEAQRVDFDYTGWEASGGTANSADARPADQVQ